MSSSVRSSAAIVLTLLTLLTAPPRVVQAQESEQSQWKFQANSAEELARSYQEHIAGASDASLDQLVANPDLSIALAAGWERVRRTVPLERQKQDVPPAPEAISRFLGFVEGRLQVPIPPRWEAAVQSAGSYGRTNIWFSNIETALDKDPDSVPLGGSVFVGVRPEGDRWVVAANKKSWSLPIDSDSRLGKRATIALSDGKMFAAIYSNIASPYSLYEVDRDSGIVLSIHKIWAAEKKYYLAGVSSHEVELRVDDDNLYVFGASIFGIYIEIIDIKKGINLGRFGDEYFESWLETTPDPK